MKRKDPLVIFVELLSGNKIFILRVDENQGSLGIRHWIDVCTLYNIPSSTIIYIFIGNIICNVKP